MPYPPHPIAQTSYPGEAELNQELGPKTYDDHDFSWSEDWLARWRAIGLFGGLILVEGVVLWGSLTSGLYAFPGGALLGMALLLGVCGIAATVFGASEVAVAFFGAAAAGLVAALACPLTYVTAGDSIFANPGSFGADVTVVLALLGAGALILAVGIIESVRTYRAESHDE